MLFAGLDHGQPQGPAGQMGRAGQRRATTAATGTTPTARPSATGSSGCRSPAASARRSACGCTRSSAITGCTRASTSPRLRLAGLCRDRRHGELGRATRAATAISSASTAGGVGTGYGHMSRIAVRSGERVSRGQVIGYSGNRACRPARISTSKSIAAARRSTRAASPSRACAAAVRQRACARSRRKVGETAGGQAGHARAECVLPATTIARPTPRS